MSFTIFYAWQSDRNQETCRFLIRDAIKGAIKQIKADATLNEAPALDHDTKDVPGTPHIALTIQKKIKRCGVFVADLTHVMKYTTDDGRTKYSPNANVLIELGLAIRAVGWERIILLMNTEFGPPEELPFDLRHHSFPVVYDLKATDVPESRDNQRLAQKMLTDALSGKLRTIIKSGIIEAAGTVARERKAAEIKALEDAAEVVRVQYEQRLLVTPYKGFHASSKFVLSIVPVHRPDAPLLLRPIKDRLTLEFRPLHSTHYGSDVFPDSVTVHNGSRSTTSDPGYANWMTEVTEFGSVFALADINRQAMEGTNGKIDRLSFVADEDEAIRRLPEYIRNLRKLGVRGRLMVGLTLLGVRNAAIVPPNTKFWRAWSPRVLEQDLVRGRAVTLDEGQEPQDSQQAAIILRPSLEDLWASGNVPADPLFDTFGRYIGPT